MSRQQATYATPEQVREHIHRQRTLGEDMLSYKEVSKGSLAVTIILIAVFFAVLKLTGV